MGQKISDAKMKIQLGLLIIALIRLWEAFEEKEKPSDFITDTQEKLKEVARALKKYKNNIPLIH